MLWFMWVLLVATGCAGTAERGSLDPSIQSPVAETWPQLNPLVRLTVGREDHFQLTGDGQDFFFTRSENLAKTVMHMRRTSSDGQIFLSHPAPVFSESFDTQDPAWNAQTHSLAYLSFARTARGEVCVRQGFPKHSGGGIGSDKCIRPKNGKIHSPVWGADGALYVLVRQMPWGDRIEDQVQRVDLLAGTFETVFRYPQIGSFTLFNGRVPHPGLLAVGWGNPDPLGGGNVQSGDRLLRPHFIWMDLSASNRPQIRFVTRFPGFPVTPQFSPDGTKLLFGQFIDDSNGDGRLDADDRSAVLSVPVEPLWQEFDQMVHQKEGIHVVQVLPEQLTEARANCLYPHQIDGQLFVTCAAAGSLDLYALRNGSRVPQHWSLEFLYSALEQAESVDEQLLMTSRIRMLEWVSVADPARRAARDSTLEAELALLHAENGDFRAAEEVLNRASVPRVGEMSSPQPDHDVDRQLNHLVLQIISNSQEFSSERVSLDYRESIKFIRQRLQDLQASEVSAGHVAAVRVGWGLLEGSLARTAMGSPSPLCLERSAFRVALRKLENSPGKIELIRYLRVAVLEEERSGRLLASEAAGCLADLALVARSDERVSSSLWVDALARSRREPQSGRVFEQEWKHSLGLKEFSQSAAGTTEHLLKLLDTQRNALQVVSLTNAQERGVAFRSFSDALKLSLAADGGPPVRRRAHARLMSAIFAEADDNLLLGYHTSNWLAATSLSAYEYGVILEQYRRVSMARGYSEWANGDSPIASDVFLQTIRLTREEEGHLCYVLSALAAGRSDELEAAYAGFERALGDVWGGRPLLQALLHLVRHRDLVREAVHADGSVDGSKSTSDQQRAALSELQAAEEALTGSMASRPLVRDLLRGYIDHERYLLSLAQDVSGNEAFYSEAYRRYSLALEWASQRSRVRSLILGLRGTLSLLGGRAAAAASDFRERRDGMRLDSGIRDTQTAVNKRFALNEARALSLSGRSGQAADVLAEVLHSQSRNHPSSSQPAHPPEVLFSLRRLEGFYLGEAGRFGDACSTYERVPVPIEAIGQGGSRDQVMRALGSMEHEAWTCFRATERERARAEFERIYRFADEGATGLPVVRAARERKIVRRMIRGDFIDGHWDLFQARAAGYLAQIADLGETRVRWLNRRRVHLGRVIDDEPTIGLSPSGFRKQRIKAALEVWLWENLPSTSSQRASEGGQDGRLKPPIDQVLVDARSVLEDGEWSPSQSDFAALLHWGLLLLLTQGGDMPSVQPAFIDGSRVFGQIVERLVGEDAGSATGSWGTGLLIQSVQIQLVAGMLGVGGVARRAPELPTGGVIGLSEASAWVDALLGADVGRVSDSERRKLAEWCVSLHQRVHSLPGASLANLSY